MALTVIWCWCSFQSTDAGHGAASPRTAPHRTGCSGANPPADLTLSMQRTSGESGRQTGGVMAKDGEVRRRIAFDAETYVALDRLAKDRMETLQELADEAFRDL